jgi:hypothetical protein
MSTSFYFL